MSNNTTLLSPNGTTVRTVSKASLTSDCWGIQLFGGLSECTKCQCRVTKTGKIRKVNKSGCFPNCGGGKTLNRMLAEQNISLERFQTVAKFL